MLGTKFKIVAGYKGGADVIIAMERGKVSGRCSWSWSSIVVQQSQWLKDRKINLLAQLSVEKHPDLQHVPLATDFVKDEPERLAPVLVLPPATPTDRVAAVRKAFEDMVKDKDVIAEFERQKQELTPVAGEKIQALIEEFYATPKGLIEQGCDRDGVGTLTPPVGVRILAPQPIFPD